MDAEATNPADLTAQDARTGQLPGWLASHGGGLEDYAFFSFATRYHFAYLGVSRASRWRSMVEIKGTAFPLSNLQTSQSV
jgi:hypothetical protein